jgi:triacylglycerol lipase
MIKEDLEEVGKTRQAWFTGHSLGAAMTTIMASRCEDDPDMPNITETYTYGSPRVGWRKYCKSLNAPHHRWVNNNDIVTRVPLRAMGYIHHGQEHYMNAYGMERKLTTWQRLKDRFRGLWMGLKKGGVDSFSDHSMDNYISNLEKNKES